MFRVIASEEFGKELEKLRERAKEGNGESVQMLKIIDKGNHRQGNREIKIRLQVRRPHFQGKNPEGIQGKVRGRKPLETRPGLVLENDIRNQGHGD
ncbi:MAG: hypothetical protein V1676_02170 [Candidatus Diapherotrites archaeon]